MERIGLGRKGMLPLFFVLNRVHWHFKNNFIALITGLDQISVGKLVFQGSLCSF